jgi:hypothetical protein
MLHRFRKSRFPGRFLVVTTATPVLFVLILTTSQDSFAQKLTVLHSFAGAPDGASAAGGLSFDKAGNLYGVTAFGGVTGGDCGSGSRGGCGTVFKLSNRGDNWFVTRLHAFAGGNDGNEPLAAVVIGPDGGLYGTTSSADMPGNGLTVFELKPGPTTSPSILSGWKKALLYSFTGGSDGQSPGSGRLIFDQAGNLYGTTTNSTDVCSPQCGNVYELTPSDGAGRKPHCTTSQAEAMAGNHLVV